MLEENLAVHRARAQAKIDAWRARPLRGGHVPTVESDARVRRAQAALDRVIAERAALRQAEQVAAQQAEQTVAAGAAGSAAAPGGEPKRNITDPQSRMMPLRGGGWLQGYNCQAVTSSNGLIIATSVGNNPNDTTAYATMLDKPQTPRRCSTRTPQHRRARSTGIGVLLADNGYLSNDNLAPPDRTDSSRSANPVI